MVTVCPDEGAAVKLAQFKVIVPPAVTISPSESIIRKLVPDDGVIISDEDNVI